MSLPPQTDPNGQTDTTGEWLFIDGHFCNFWTHKGKSHILIRDLIIQVHSDIYVLFDWRKPKIINTFSTLKEAQAAHRMIMLTERPKS